MRTKLQRRASLKFSELKQTKKGGVDDRAQDTSGREDYEMAIRGPAPLVSKAFAKSEFEIQIDTALSGEAAQKRVVESLAKYSATAKAAISTSAQRLSKSAGKISRRNPSSFPFAGPVAKVPFGRSTFRFFLFLPAPIYSSRFRRSGPAPPRCFRYPGIQTSSSR